MFDYLEKKVKTLNDINKECSLALDEGSIEGGRMYDPQSEEFIGDITIPSKNNSKNKSDDIEVEILKKRSMAWYIC